MFGGRLFGAAKPQILPASSHGIRRDTISSCALRTTQALQKEGFAAFVVGGAVRDLILGMKPKDFDIATDATPEQVRALFRRSRVIGRRFRLVHVLCGPEMVEVSTFRGSNASPEDDGDARVADEHGRILRDNVFGTQEQDATRRDFTLNALFYDPATQEVWDYHGGVADLKKRRLRLIGDPELRYREDPVRMLRAVRFAAGRGLEIDAATRRPIRRLAGLLAHVPPSRLLDEMLKLLLSGHAAEAIVQLKREGLHHGVLPLLDASMGRAAGERFVVAALKATDERLRAGKGVSPGFLFAALLWPEVQAEWQVQMEKGVPEIPALYQAMDHVMNAQAGKLPIPHRYGGDMREIWALQPRFLQRAGKRPYRLLEHPRFRAGYDFLVLRAQSGDADAALGEWWERFQDAGETERGQMLVADAAPRGRRRRRRRPRRDGGGGMRDEGAG